MFDSMIAAIRENTAKMMLTVRLRKNGGRPPAGAGGQRDRHLLCRRCRRRHRAEAAGEKAEETRPQRPLPLRQRAEVQEMLRPQRVSRQGGRDVKKGWKRAALAAAAAGLSLALAGCSLPMTGFADYDVSGYFQALLDSSYKGENTSYMAVAAATEEVAQQNNTATVANAAVNFCNTYGLSPSDDQLTQLEDVMRQALRQADYTVKDEQKVDGGYYLEVEIDPIVNFSGLEDTISQLRTEAEEEATLANSSSSQDEDSYGSDDSTYGYDGGSYGDGYDDSYGDGYGDSYDSYSDGAPMAATAVRTPAPLTGKRPPRRIRSRWTPTPCLWTRWWHIARRSFPASVTVASR